MAMGYTMSLVLLFIVLAPVLLVAALALQMIGRRYGFSPGGMGGLVSYLLIVCSGYAVVCLGITADLLVREPARLQGEYIGEVVAGPASLVYFEKWGFQDPGSEWRYRLSPARSAELRRRCKEPGRGGGSECTLFSAQDERWSATVELEGNELRMMEVFH
jgi:hypothetical protein